MNEKSQYVPDHETYKHTLGKLTENNEIMTLLVIRLGCELGLTRLEIVNIKIDDIGTPHARCLKVRVAKRVRRGTKIVDGKKLPIFKMRIREIPINVSLFQIVKTYMSNSNIYLLHREKGNQKKPFIPRYINYLYGKNNVPWSPHKSRHYFKSQVWSWMMKNKQPDRALLQELMGHQKDVHDSYGEYSWDYKQEVLDKVFEG